MSTSYVCGRCAQRIAKFQGIFSRSYSSLGRSQGHIDSVIVQQKRRPVVYCENNRGNRNDGRSKIRFNHHYHSVRKAGDDKVLESLFSSSLDSSDQAKESRHSETPISSQNVAIDECQDENAPVFRKLASASIRRQAWALAHAQTENHEKDPSPADSGRFSVRRLRPSGDRFSMRRLSKTQHDAPSAGAKREGTQDQDVGAALSWAINKSLKESNAEYASTAWINAKRYLDQQRRTHDAERTDLLFTKLLSAFFELRQADKAIEVWNHMVQEGYEVNKIHWTAMLHGCVKGRDASSLKLIWENMNMNIPADIVAWTTYISGLIKCRRWHDGIEALNQLGKLWGFKPEDQTIRRHKAAPTVKAGVNVAPSLAPVKAAIDAFIDIDREDLAPMVLGWASNHGLKPDVHTYNILLRPLARRGDLQGIKSHLALMSANGCQPDITTFTTFISTLISSPESDFHSLPPQDQESTLLGLLDDMGAARVPPNAFTYSTLLSALLKPFPETPRPRSSGPIPMSSSPSAWKKPSTSVGLALLTHMRMNAVAPTPHIYTILLRHHFSSPSPNMHAIQAIWDSMRSPGITPDNIFYDRLIEGLAKVGQAEKSLSFVRKMAKDGKTPSWVAMGRCLDALVAEGMWREVRWLVDQVDREGGLMKWGGRELRGKGAWMKRTGELRSEGWLKPGENDYKVEDLRR